MELEHMLSMKLDYASIMERLGEIDSYHWDHSQSEYYGDYADLFNELALLAADLYNDLGRLIQALDSTDILPWRRVTSEVAGYRGTTWFNEAVSIMAETDMDALLRNDGIYDYDMAEREKERRNLAIMALSKQGMYFLLTEVFNFVVRFIQLNLAFQAICGSIDELERLNSFREHNGVPQLPSSAYV